MFALLCGNEDIDVTAAQMSYRTRDERVEDYASMLLRSQRGVLGTLEIGYSYPRIPTPDNQGPGRDKLLDGADGEWKIAGRDALLSMAKDGALRVVTSDDEQTLPGVPEVNPSWNVLRDALDRWQRGDAPTAGVEDALRAARLIDRGYGLAGVGL